MEQGRRNGEGEGGRYSARRTVVPVNFLCALPEARGAERVCVVGDFNGWDPSACVLGRGDDGSWQGVFLVHSGYHRYLFLVDGVRFLDPRARGVVRLEGGLGGGEASLLSVG